MTEKEIADKCYELVLEFFKNDYKKTDMWMRTPNMLIGGSSPLTFIKLGRGEKLLQFIEGRKLDGGWGLDSQVETKHEEK